MWVTLSLGSALFNSFFDLFNKRAVSKTTQDVVLFSALLRILVSLTLLPVWLFFDSQVEVKPEFLLPLIISGVVNLFAFNFYLNGLKGADLSLVAPILGCSSIWTLLTSRVINGESITLISMSGAIFVVLGIYITNLSRIKTGNFLTPITSISKNRALRNILYATLCWSICVPYDKEAILASSPLFFLLSINIFLAIGFTLLGLSKKKSRAALSSIKCDISILASAFSSAISDGFQMYAMALVPVPLVLSLKRTSILLGITWGILFFNEKGFREKILGGIITLIGVVVIVWGR